MRHWLRQLILSLTRWLGIIRLCQFIRRNKIPILVVHGVMDEADHLPWKPLRPRLSQDKLDNYLKVLSKRYRFVPLMDAVEMLQGRKPMQPYSMVLTFDDGYRNNLTHALPILRHYNTPATFMVPTGFLNNPRPFWFDRLDYALQQIKIDGRELKLGSLVMHLDCTSRKTLRESFVASICAAKEQQMSDVDFLLEMGQLSAQLEGESGRRLSDIQKQDDWSEIMTWEQIEKEANDNNVSFGSHTVDHVRLGLVEDKIALDQLTISKRDIEIHTGKPCQSLCYPNGSFTDETIDLVQNSNYNCGVTSMEGLNHIGDDVMKLRRIALPVNVKTTDLLFRISVTCR